MAVTLLYLIIGFIIIEFLVSKYIDYKNLRTWELPIPAELKDLYTPEQVTKAKDYAQANARIGTISDFISLGVSLAMLLLGFAAVDRFAKGLTNNTILQSLIFFAIMGLGSFVIGLPFSIYRTFVIEEKFGFNKSTLSTFIADKIKGMLIGAVIGGVLISLLVFLFQLLGSTFWLAAWAVLSGFSIFFAMFYTNLLLPIFNKLTPLEGGELRQAIEDYAGKVDFPLTNVFVMDGSKRSSKANAFFSGLGSKKNIVLYDTLIKDLSTEEITAVLAHEVGHYKKKHVLQGILLSVAQMGLLFFLFGWLSANPLLAQMLGAEENNFHLALIAFMLLYSPIGTLTGLFMNLFSRKNEYQADRYAKETFSEAPLISSLKKMTVNHLSNPQPHPAYVFMHYSHPTLLQRMRAMKG
jgi:STE24 endopeptidase